MQLIFQFLIHRFIVRVDSLAFEEVILGDLLRKVKARLI